MIVPLRRTRQRSWNVDAFSAFIPKRVVYRSREKGRTINLSQLRLHTTAFLCSGYAEYTFGKHEGNTIDYMAGDILWMPKGSWRKSVFGADISKFITIQFDINEHFRLQHDFTYRFFHTPAIVRPANPGYVEGLFRRIYRLRGHQSPSAHVEAQGVFLQIVSAVAQAFEQQRTPPHLLVKVQQIEDYILNHFDDPTLTVAKLAQMSGWSTKHFIASFKEVTGQTPLVYLRRVRMNHALDLLSQEDLSVQDVALMVGYEDPAYFSRVFRQTVGIPPSQCKYSAQHDRIELMSQGKPAQLQWVKGANDD